MTQDQQKDFGRDDCPVTSFTHSVRKISELRANDKLSKGDLEMIRLGASILHREFVTGF